MEYKFQKGQIHRTVLVYLEDDIPNRDRQVNIVKEKFLEMKDNVPSIIDMYVGKRVDFEHTCSCSSPADLVVHFTLSDYKEFMEDPFHVETRKFIVANTAKRQRIEFIYE